MQPVNPDQDANSDTFGVLSHAESLLRQQVAAQAEAEAPVTSTPVETPPTEVVTDDAVFAEAPAEPVVDSTPEEEEAIAAYGFTAIDPARVKITRPTVSDKQTPSVESLDMPPARLEHMESQVSRVPNLSDSSDMNDVNWSRTFMGSASYLPQENQYKGALEREDADWQQGLFDNNAMVRSVTPRFSRNNKEKLTGDSAVQYALSYLGLGDLYVVNLWNSGFWVTFKPAPDVSWETLNRLLAAEDIRIGRSSYGLSHSSHTALTQATIVDYISQFVYSTSVKTAEMPISDIRKYMSVHDIPNFIYGFLAANYPHGLTIDRACVAGPEKCREVISQTLEMTELQVVDNSMVDTPELRAHVRQRQAGSVALADVLRYQKNLRANAPYAYDVLSGSQKKIRFHLAPPSAEKEFEMSYNYIEDIKQGVLSAVTADTSVAERNTMMNESIAATDMCVFSHWVQAIEFEPENIVDDPAAISKMLLNFTKDATLRDNFMRAVMQYIDRSVVSILGIAPLTCSKCGAVHSRPHDDHPEFSDFIPLDIVNVFCHLAEFKSRIIRARVQQ